MSSSYDGELCVISGTLRDLANNTSNRCSSISNNDSSTGVTRQSSIEDDNVDVNAYDSLSREDLMKLVVSKDKDLVLAARIGQDLLSRFSGMEAEYAERNREVEILRNYTTELNAAILQDRETAAASFEESRAFSLRAKFAEDSLRQLEDDHASLKAHIAKLQLKRDDDGLNNDHENEIENDALLKEYQNAAERSDDARRYAEKDNIRLRQELNVLKCSTDSVKEKSVEKESESVRQRSNTLRQENIELNLRIEAFAEENAQLRLDTAQTANLTVQRDMLLQHRKEDMRVLKQSQDRIDVLTKSLEEQMVVTAALEESMPNQLFSEKFRRDSASLLNELLQTEGASSQTSETIAISPTPVSPTYISQSSISLEKTDTTNAFGTSASPPMNHGVSLLVNADIVSPNGPVENNGFVSFASMRDKSLKEDVKQPSLADDITTTTFEGRHNYTPSPPSCHRIVENLRSSVHRWYLADKAMMLPVDLVRAIEQSFAILYKSASQTMIALTDFTIKNVNSDIQSASPQLQRLCRSRRPIVHDNTPGLVGFLGTLEKILQHGLTRKRGGLFSSTKRVGRDYFDWILNLPKNMAIYYELKHAQGLLDATTTLGKGRAFIRIALVQKSLADTIQQLLVNTELLEEFYHSEAFLRNSSCAVALQQLLYELGDSLDFDLALRDVDVDHSWTLRFHSVADIGNCG